jgi:beta-glucosidase
MNLPHSSDRLIAAVLEANPEAVIITQSGAPIVMPWVNAATTLLHTWYSGNEVGRGIADVIFGHINPAAKLPVSFPRDIRETPSYLNFGSERGRVVYGESIYVGYRYYEKLGRDVMFPFG